MLTKSMKTCLLSPFLVVAVIVGSVGLLMAPCVTAQIKNIPPATTQAEADAYKSAAAIADLDERARAADNFAKNFPDSQWRASLYEGSLVPYYQNGNLDRVIAMGHKILNIDPDDPVALVLVADALTTSASEGNPPDRDQRLNEAVALARRGLQTINSGIRLPEDTAPALIESDVNYLFSTAYADIARFELAHSDFPGAECDYRRSMSVMPSHVDTLNVFFLAQALEMQQKLAEALEYMNKALQTAPSNSEFAASARDEQKRITTLLGQGAGVITNPDVASSCGELPQPRHIALAQPSGSSAPSPGSQAAAPAASPQTGNAVNSRPQTDSAEGQRGVSVAPRPKPGLVGTDQTGRYVALVIGINDYRDLPKLKTAVNDANSVANTLHNLYGFDTRILLEASRNDITKALNEYRRTLDENTNFLVYYAGHGFYDKDADKAYWLPADAEPGDTSNWIIADEITTDIKVIPARHILIISDSCYSGGITREISPAFTPQERGRYLQKMIAGRSRTLMSSGGLEPVSDAGSQGHSVFADALLRGLTTSDDQAFSAEILFQEFIRVSVAGKSEQTPQYGAIRNSGHDAGDFVFVRVAH